MAKKPIDKKKLTKWIVSGVCVLAALTGIYYYAIVYLLADYENMAYITFTYNLSMEEGQTEPEVTINKVNASSNYPAKFRIPSELLGYKVTAIGEQAFSLCTRLTEVIMPETIEYIGDGAFLNCENLSKIRFSPNIEFIGTDALSGTAYLANQPDGFLYIGDSLYTYKGTLPAGTQVKSGTGSEPNTVYLDDSLTSVSSGLFKNQTGIVSVEFPDTLESIGSSVFENCTNLTSVVMPDSVTSIGSYAFLNTTSLTTIDLPASLEEMGVYAFQNSGIAGSITIPGSLTFVPVGAFLNNVNLETVIVSEGVQKIQDYAFQDCSSLESITFSSTVDWLGTGAFLNNTSLVSITMPKSSDFSVIGESLFMGNTSLETVYIYDNITSIRKNAFRGTTVFDSLIVLDDSDAPITAAHMVSIPSTVTAIGDFAFSQSGVSSVIIPAMVSTISEGLFEDAVNLATVDIQLPLFGNPRLLTVKSAAFSGCIALTSLVLPDSVTAIGDSFLRDSGITSFVFPSGITTINEYSFANCVDLASVTLPAGLITIKSYAFQECDAMTSLVIPASTMYIYDYAFIGSTGLTIYAEIATKPLNWKTNWNVDNLPVVWGYVAG